MGNYVISTQEFNVGTGGKTLLQLVTSSGNRAVIFEIGVAFQGTSASDAPVLVEIMRQTTAGTGTSVTPVLLDPADAAAECTAGKNFSAEPTASDILENWYLTPNGGLMIKQYPLGREPVMAVSTRVGVKATVAAAVDATAYIVFQEL